MSGSGVVVLPVACPLPEVLLWRIDLDQALDAAARRTLSEDESARARRFHFARDRHRFELGRAALRQLLATRLGCTPAAVKLGMQGQGKPVLAEPAHGLHFNLSHSDGVCLVAITAVAPVGVDIERLRELSDLSELAREHFAPDEIRQLESVLAEQRTRVFLRGWTRKEACLKAWATGLGLPARSIETGLEPGQRLVIPPAPDVGAALALVSLTWPHNDGYEAAVALGTAGGARRR